MFLKNVNKSKQNQIKIFSPQISPQVFIIYIFE
jgi:hypothetical protein